MARIIVQNQIVYLKKEKEFVKVNKDFKGGFNKQTPKVLQGTKSKQIKREIEYGEKKAKDIILPLISQRKLRALSSFDMNGQKIIENLNETISSSKINTNYDNINTVTDKSQNFYEYDFLKPSLNEDLSLSNKKDNQLSVPLIKFSKLKKNEINFAVESAVHYISPQITHHKKLNSHNKADIQTSFFENGLIKTASMHNILFSERKVHIFSAIHKEKKSQLVIPQQNEKKNESIQYGDSGDLSFWLAPKNSLDHKNNIEHNKNLQFESKYMKSDHSIVLRSINLKFRGTINKKEFNINIPKTLKSPIIEKAFGQNKLVTKNGLNFDEKLNKSPIISEKDAKLFFDERNNSNITDSEYFVSNGFNNQSKYTQNDKYNLALSQNYNIEHNKRYTMDIDMGMSLQFLP